MSSPPRPETPTLVKPPGPVVHDLHVLASGRITYSPSSTGSLLPQLFRDALVVRTVVFVLEQKCSAAEEIDADDGISWHWVIHAPRTEKEALTEAEDDWKDRRDEDRSEGEPGAMQDPPAATIRLVPAQAHPDADDEKAVDGPNYAGSRLWDHKEPYVKIGRLATMEGCRGRGYGKVLVNAALEYAGRNGGEMVKDKELGEWKGLVLAHAQKSVEGWYKGLGFELDEGMGRWWEEGIEHVAMWERVRVE